MLRRSRGLDISSTSDTMGTVQHDQTSVRCTLGRAFQTGAIRSFSAFGGCTSATSDFSGSCQSPREVLQEGLLTRPAVLPPSRRRSERSSDDAFVRHAFLVRCRKCDVCLRYRSFDWRTRALAEIGLSVRTWFGTLTLSPQEHYRFRCAASKRYGSEFDALSVDEQLPRLHAEISVSLTRALKRLRKRIADGSAAPFRYLLVCERHKSGLPHYHMLLHETDVDRPIRKSLLNEWWPHGFSQWRLAKPEAAGYVAKYLSKSAAARVRASQRYGEGCSKGEARLPLRTLLSQVHSHVNTRPQTNNTLEDLDCVKLASGL